MRSFLTMNKYVCLAASFLLSVAFCPAQVTVKNLLTENLTDPVGLDAKAPDFSWQLVTAGDGSGERAGRGSAGDGAAAKRNVMQTAYEIRVSAMPGGKG
ncbi:MAG TPA: hypothetical protein VK563_05780, partial [Puia sp.]|nr:hypothetical protein [Puia sp.]